MVFLRGLVPSKNLNEEGKARGWKMFISFCVFVFEKVSIVRHVLILKSQFLRERIVMGKKYTN